MFGLGRTTDTDHDHHGPSEAHIRGEERDRVRALMEAADASGVVLQSLVDNGYVHSTRPGPDGLARDVADTLVQLTRERAQLARDNAALRTENANLTAANQRLTIENQTLQQAREGLVAQNQQLIGEKAQLTHENTRLTHDVAALTAAAEQASAALDQAQMDIAGLRGENVSMRTLLGAQEGESLDEAFRRALAAAAAQAVAAERVQQGNVDADADAHSDSVQVTVDEAVPTIGADPVVDRTTAVSEYDFTEPAAPRRDQVFVREITTDAARDVAEAQACIQESARAYIAYAAPVVEHHHAFVAVQGGDLHVEPAAADAVAEPIDLMQPDQLPSYASDRLSPAAFTLLVHRILTDRRLRDVLTPREFEQLREARHAVEWYEHYRVAHAAARDGFER